MTAQNATGLGDVADKGPPLLISRLWVASFLIVCLTLVCITSRDGLLNLYDRWTYEEEYGYGYLVVALMPLLLWRRWHQIPAVSTGSRWPGLAVVVVAQLCTIVASLGESYFIEQIAFVLNLLGIGLVVAGAGAFRALVPLAVLLLLTVPLPYTLQTMMTIELQLLSTNLGVAAIKVIGIPVIAEGNIIDLGVYKLQLVEACSGLRYLLPLSCISFILAYLYKAPIWKKAIIVASGAPIAVLINSLRIAVVAVLVDSFGTQMAEGFLHQFEGWVMFIFGALLLGLEIAALEGFRRSGFEIEPVMDLQPASKRMPEPMQIGGAAIMTVLVCAAALGVTNSITSALELNAVPVRDAFAQFPRRIGGWTALQGQLEPDVASTLKATDYYIGDFVEGANGPTANLFVAYYDSLSKDAAIHSPQVCLPGSGWEFSSFEERPFAELAPGAVGTYNRAVIQKGEQKILMFYWYQQRGRRIGNEFSMKYYLLVDSLSKGRKDGALVRLYTSISGAGDKGEANAEARLRSFAQPLLSEMTRFLPQ